MPFSESYLEAVIRDEVRKVAGAHGGTRNYLLNSAAFNLASLGVDEKRIVFELIPAAERCGLVKDDGAKSVRGTIGSGIRGGRAAYRTGLCRLSRSPR